MRIYWKLPDHLKEDCLTRATLRFISEAAGFFVSPEPDADTLTVDWEEGSRHSLPRKLVDEIRDQLFLARWNDPVVLQKPRLDFSVNRFADDLIQQVTGTDGICIRKHPWPAGRPFAVLLTHDVDLTRQYSLKKMLGSLLSLRLSSVIEEGRGMFGSENIAWTFPGLLAEYRQHHLKATFFFIARRWEGFSYRYNIRSTKFRQLLNDLSLGGYEIGLHSSRYVFDHLARLKREQNNLNDLLERNVRGVRQHYLNLTFPLGWQVFAEHGFGYDTSCGLNEANGFRAGTSLPFHVPVTVSGKERWITEVPFSVMDYPWVEATENPTERWSNFMAMAGQVRQSAGLLTVLFHPGNLGKPEFRVLWKQLLGWLSKQNAHTDTISGLLEWRLHRERVMLESLRQDRQKLEVVLFSPHAFENLALTIYSRRKLSAAGKNFSLASVQGEKKLVVLNKVREGRNRLIFNVD